MLPFLSWFFGCFLFTFIVVSLVIAFRRPKNRRSITIAFFGLHCASLLFVLIFVLGSSGELKPQFVELGLYYPLTSSDQNSRGFSIGDKDHEVDYVLDEDCRREPCFKGQIDFTYTQQSVEKNTLTWVISDTVTGSFGVTGPDGSVVTDGSQGVAIGREASGIKIIWSGKQDEVSRQLILACDFQLDPPNKAQPRVVIGHPEATIKSVLLPFGTSISSENKDQAPPKAKILLTSSEQAIGLQSNGANFIPVMQVAKSGNIKGVNAFIEWPGASDNCGHGYIVNSGIDRLCVPYGAASTVGTDRGVVFAVILVDKTQQLIWSLILTAIWIATGLFYYHYIISRSYNARKVQDETEFGNGPFLTADILLVLLPTVQMALAVRFVLCLRVYWWSPNSSDAIESALLSLLLIPLLIFIGCHAYQFGIIGKMFPGILPAFTARGRDFGQYLSRQYPPLYFLVCCMVIFTGSFLLLHFNSPLNFATSDLAFQNWAYFVKSLFFLAGVPAVVFLAGFVLGHVLSWGGRYSQEADPFTFLLFDVGNKKAKVRKGGKPNLVELVLIYLIPFIAVALLSVVLYLCANESGRLYQGLCFASAAAAALLLWLLSERVGRGGENSSYFMSCFCQNLSIIYVCLAVIFLFRTALPPLHNGLLNPAVVFGGLSLRTNTVFEILILILNIRLLKNFFEDWSKTTENFGGSGVIKWFFLFLAPALMFSISFLGSRDFGSSLVHIPAQIGLLVLVTSSWAIWKYAAGGGAALVAFVGPLLIIGFYYFFVATPMASLITPDRGTFSQRVLLRQGVDTALQESEKGGKRLIEAIEQQWRMMNYAAAGGVLGKGYGQSPVQEGGRTFKDVTLDELVFSVYILSEHGVLGGFAVLGLYGLILTLVFLGAWQAYNESAGDKWRELRFGLTGGLALMIFFPAVYMAAANVSQVLFTGQNLPLLNLRSESDVLRSGIILLLLMMALQPFAVRKKDNIPVESPTIFERLSLIWSVFKGRSGKKEKLKKLGYTDDSPAMVGGAVIWTNMVLVSVSLVILLGVSFYGIGEASNNEKYLKNLDYTQLREKAVDHIRNSNIWVEPVPPNGSKYVCDGKNKNKAAPEGVDPLVSYRLCIDKVVSGGGENETLSAFIKEWNSAERRGNSEDAGEWNDGGKFFILNIDLMAYPDAQNGEKIRVNQNSKNQPSPFRTQRGWDGLLTEAGEANEGNGGVLIGGNLVLPLIDANVGNGPGEAGTLIEPVSIEEGGIHKPARGFAIAKTKNQSSIFRISTKRDALGKPDAPAKSSGPGAVLDAVSGDFDIFLNGTAIGSRDEKGAVGRVRLIDGDVICYAKEDKEGRRVPTDVFIFSNAKIGAFSFVTWVNGKKDRFYPQGAALPMAKQITAAISLNRETKEGKPANNDVALTLRSDLNKDVYDLIRKWRSCLDGKGQKKVCEDMGASSSPISEKTNRRMAVSLMDPNTGSMLALAADDGEPDDPNLQAGPNNRSGDKQNLNLIRHDVGSAIKPLTASATLLSFPDLYRMTVVDSRPDKSDLFGLPLGSKKKGIEGHGKEISWEGFLPSSDNLYALTIAMLGMSRENPGQGLPRFGSEGNYQTFRPPYRLELTGNGTTAGMPEWAEPNMFKPESESAENRLALLSNPLGRNLRTLFDVRTDEPELKSFDNQMWWRNAVENPGLFEKPNSFDTVSPEITNFAFPKISDYSALRSVLLGGGFNTGSNSLTPYGSIGGKWSNVFLTQSIARIVTGKKVVSSIVSTGQPAPDFEEWFPGAANSSWRLAMLRGLEGVVLDNSGTARGALSDVVRKLQGRDRVSHAFGSNEPDLFTVFAKTGTLGYPDSKIPLKDSSTFIFTMGKWNDREKRMENGVSGAIFIEQGGEGQSQLFAAQLIKLLNEKHFKWKVADRK